MKPTNIFSSFNILSVSKVTDIISKYKIDLLYLGGNRNGSYLEQDVVEQMMKNAGGVPIVGYFSKDSNDFTDHYGEIVEEIKGAEIQTVEHKPTPYGYIPEGAQFTYHKKVDEDGYEREYLTVDAYLWDGRYEELKILQNGAPNNISMELNPDTCEGELIEVESVPFYKFTKADLCGVCILGKNVEPCFQGAELVKYSANGGNKELIDTLKQMKYELNAALEEESAEPVEPEEPKEPEIESDPLDDVPQPEEPTPDLTDDKDDGIPEPLPDESEGEDVEPTADDLDSVEDDVAEQEEEANADSKVSIEDLMRENSELRSAIEDLRKSYSSMETEYKQLCAERDARKAAEEHSEREALVNASREDIGEENYNDLMANVDNYSLEQLKSEIAVRGFAYLKALRSNFNLNSAKDNNPEIVNDLREPETQDEDWIKAVRSYKEN